MNQARELAYTVSTTDAREASRDCCGEGQQGMDMTYGLLGIPKYSHLTSD